MSICAHWQSPVNLVSSKAPVLAQLRRPPKFFISATEESNCSRYSWEGRGADLLPRLHGSFFHHSESQAAWAGTWLVTNSKLQCRNTLYLRLPTTDPIPLQINIPPSTLPPDKR